MVAGKNSFHLSHDALKRPVLVKRSSRARRMTLWVSSARRNVTLTIPRNTARHLAGAFIEQHLDWLNQQIEELPSPVPFVDGALVPVEGEVHRLWFCGPRHRRQAGHAVVSFVTGEAAGNMAADGTDSLSLPLLRVSGAREHAPRRLADWLKKRARKKIAGRVDVHAARLGLSYARIGVRDQTSRWGSCSSNKTLSFSWRLIFAPPVVLDYVAAHEVAHLQEMNHSARFWKLVGKTLPEYEQGRSWLRRHGQDLHRYGVDE